MEKKILDSHNAYIERINLYRNQGWDFIEERKKIIACLLLIFIGMIRRQYS